MKTVFASITALALIGCGSDVSSSLATNNTKLKSRNDIKEALATTPKDDNIVWSATSLDGLLALVGLGYDDERQELLSNYLGTSIDKAASSSQSLNIDKKGLKIQSANNIWIQDNFKLKPGYEASLAKFYPNLVPGTLNASKPSETADLINQWASDNTNQLIKQIVTRDTITPDLASLLANALYFKGTWKEEFKKKLTADENFNSVEKSSGKVSIKKTLTMKKLNVKLQIALDNTSKDIVTIRLPYKGDTHAMYISFATKPVDDSNDFSIVTEVDPSKDVVSIYRKYIVDGKAFKDDYKHTKKFSSFTMPKFTVESKLDGIQNTLADAGYKKLFGTGVLSRMTDNGRAQLSSVFQKAKIIVNEEGTEAAAVTGGAVTITSVLQPQHLKVNGPFAFAIRDDEKGLTLFEGMVRSPKI